MMITGIIEPQRESILFFQVFGKTVNKATVLQIVATIQVNGNKAYNQNTVWNIGNGNNVNTSIILSPVQQTKVVIIG